MTDVEWLNERMHEQIKVNLTEKSWNNLGQLTLIVLHKYTHVKPAALPYLRVTAAAVLNKSVELDWNWPPIFIMDLLHLFIGVPE